jgi:uncharacterized membrane protein YesL
MRATLKILWNGLVNAYDGAFMLVLSNLFFSFMLLPIVTIPLAFAGLYYSNFQLAAGESVDWKTFFEGIKRHWWTGTRWTVINAVVLFSLTFYILFFINRPEIWASAMTGLSLGIMAIWVLVQSLSFPMMLKQEKPAYLIALRNSLIFIVHWPGYSFAFLFPIVALVVISLYFPPIFIFLSAGLIAYLGSYAINYKLEEIAHPELFKDPRHE